MQLRQVSRVYIGLQIHSSYLHGVYMSLVLKMGLNRSKFGVNFYSSFEERISVHNVHTNMCGAFKNYSYTYKCIKYGENQVRIGQRTRYYYRQVSPNLVFSIFNAFAIIRMIYKATYIFIWTL